MFDSNSSTTIFKSQVKSLAALMDVGSESTRLWGPDELAAIFRHQMSAPVLVDLGGFDPGTALRLKTLSDAQGLLLKSFSDLFHHASPPIELLRLTKEFAKANMDHPDSGMPTEVVSLLYYMSIATALVRLGVRITQLPDPDLRRGLLWANEQPWLDADSKTLLVKALDMIQSNLVK
jgi:hypothetical protein